MDIVLSEQEIIERKVRTFLKGCVVGFSIRAGRKYDSSRPMSEDFEAGMKIAIDLPEWTSKDSIRQDATIYHIIHNASRHNRGHLGNISNDAQFLRNHGYSRGCLNYLRTRYGETSFDFLKKYEEINVLITV